jgi:hypothetical protein
MHGAMNIKRKIFLYRVSFSCRYCNLYGIFCIDMSSLPLVVDKNDIHVYPYLCDHNME